MWWLANQLEIPIEANSKSLLEIHINLILKTFDLFSRENFDDSQLINVITHIASFEWWEERIKTALLLLEKEDEVVEKLRIVRD